MKMKVKNLNYFTGLVIFSILTFFPVDSAHSQLLDLELATVDQNGFNLAGVVQSNGFGSASPGTIPNVFVGQGRFAKGIFNGIDYRIDNIDTLPHLVDSTTAKVDAATGATTFVQNLSPGFSRIQFVFTIADITVETVDIAGNQVPGAISLPGVGGTGSALVSQYLSGKGFSLTAVFGGVTYSTPDIDVDLFRPGRTVRVDAVTGALLPDGPSIANDQAEIEVVFSTTFQLQLATVDQDEIDLGAFGGTISSQGINAEPSPSSFLTYTIGEARFAQGDFSGVSYNIPNIDTLPHVADGQTAKVDVGTGLTTFVSDQSPGVSRIHFVFSRVETLTVKTVDNGFVQVAGSISLPGVGGTGIAFVPNYVSGQGFSLTTNLSGIIYTTPDIDVDLFRSGRTVRVDALTGLLLPDGPSLASNRAEIQVVYPGTLQLQLATVDQDDVDLGIFGGTVSSQGLGVTSPSSFFAYTIGEARFAEGSFNEVSYNIPNIDTLPHVVDGQTAEVDVVTGTTTFVSDQASGSARIHFVYSRAETLVVKTVDNGFVQVAGSISLPGVGGTGIATLPHYVAGKGFSLTTIFGGITYTTPSIDVSLFNPGRTVRVDAVTGVLLPDGPALASNRAEIQVVYSSSLQLRLATVDQDDVDLGVFGGGISSQGLNGVPSPVDLAYTIGEARFAQGSFNAVSYNIPNIDTLPHVVDGQTANVDVVTGTTTFVSDQSSGSARIHFVYTRAETLTVKTVDNGFVQVAGSISLPGVGGTGIATLPHYVVGKGFSLTTIFGGITYTTPSIDVSLFNPGRTVRVDAVTGLLLPDGPALASNRAEIQVVYSTSVQLQLATVDQDDVDLGAFGGGISSQGINGAPSPVDLAYTIGEARFALGSFNAVSYNIPNIDTLPHVVDGQTAKVDVVTGTTTFVSDQAPGSARIHFVYSRAETLTVKTFDQHGTLIPGTISMPGLGVGSPGSVTIPNYVSGQGFFLTTTFSGVVYSTPNIDVDLFGLGRTIRVDAATGALLPDGPPVASNHIVICVVYTNIVELQLATVDQDEVDLGVFGGAVSSQGINQVPSPSAFIVNYTLGEGRFAEGEFNAVSYNIPNIDTLPHVEDGQTAKVDVNTGVTTFVSDQSPGFARIHFVYTRAETLTVKTVDQNGNIVLGAITMPGIGVGSPGVVTVPHYVLGQAFTLATTFSSITYSTPNIETDLFRLGRTVRVDAGTGTLLPDGPALASNMAEIQVVYTNTFQLQFATVDQDEVDLGVFGGGISSQGLNGVPSPSSFFVYTIGEARFAQGDFNAVSYNIPNIDTLYVGGVPSGPYVRDGQTAKVDVNTGATTFASDQSLGFTRVHFVYARAETLTVKTLDQNGNVVAGTISMPGFGVGSPGVVTVPHYVLGQAFSLTTTFSSLIYTTPNIETDLFRLGRTIRVDAASGILLPDGPALASNRAEIQVVYGNVFQLQLATVDQDDVDLGSLGGAISSQGLNGVPSPSSFFLYTLGEGRFAAGDFKGVTYNIPDIDTLPHVVDGNTAKVNVNTGATTFVPDQATGFTRIHFVYTRAETLRVKTVDQDNNILLGQISMPGLGVGFPGVVTVPNYVLGQGFFLNATFFGITYSAPDIDVSLFNLGRTVRVDALTGALLPDGPPLPPNEAEIWVVYQVIPITIRTIDQNGSDIDGLVALGGDPGGTPSVEHQRGRRGDFRGPGGVPGWELGGLYRCHDRERRHDAGRDHPRNGYHDRCRECHDCSGSR